jgi:hypothetical protein
MRKPDLLPMKTIVRMSRWASFAILRVLLAVSALIAADFAVSGEKAERTYITAPIERGSIDTVVKTTGTVNPVVMVEVAFRPAFRSPRRFQRRCEGRPGDRTDQSPDLHRGCDWGQGGSEDRKGKRATAEGGARGSESREG